MTMAGVVCRGCLQKENDLQNMFDFNYDQDFVGFTNIQVERHDGISEMLCASCRGNLLSLRRFRERCVASDNTLRRQMTELLTNNVTYNENNNFNDNIDVIVHSFVGPRLTTSITPKNLNSSMDSGITCPYNCKVTFLKKNILHSHMVRDHGFDPKTLEIELNYYCMFENCPYSAVSEKKKSFARRKTLKSHIINMHTSRNYKCNVCGESFPQRTQYERHKNTCGTNYLCIRCNVEYKTNERLLVHLMRKHPDLHKEYKMQKKLLKRTRKEMEGKFKLDEVEVSPKRTFATQTFDPKLCINDVNLNECTHSPHMLKYTQTDELNIFTSNETQTGFGDILSIRSEDDLETSLLDTQTQTFEKVTCQTQTNTFLNMESPDLRYKETQTCFCFVDSPKPAISHFNFPKYIFDSANSSPNNLTSTETQTAEVVTKDVLLSFNSIETQTNEDYLLDSGLNI